MYNVKKIVSALLFFTASLQANSNLVFSHIYANGSWKNSETYSGSGSTIAQTETIRIELAKLIRELQITSILDVPCGDFNWMKLVDIDNCYYIGADIVKPMIEKNQELYAAPNRLFKYINVVSDMVPEVDLILCRDLFVHLPFQDIKNALRNLQKSKSTYLLTTSFTNKNRKNMDITVGDWRPLNLELPPFNFPKPIKIINENCSEDNGKYNDKCLILWKIDELFFEN